MTSLNDFYTGIQQYGIPFGPIQSSFTALSSATTSLLFYQPSQLLKKSRIVDPTYASPSPPIMRIVSASFNIVSNASSGTPASHITWDFSIIKNNDAVYQNFFTCPLPFGVGRSAAGPTATQFNLRDANNLGFPIFVGDTLRIDLSTIPSSFTVSTGLVGNISLEAVVFGLAG